MPSNSSAVASFYWHDYETFGLDPQRDRPVQFAGVRTDADFKVIDDPLLIYCKPSPDYLPNPDACAITGITPQLALAKGVCEAEFIAHIHQQLAQPNTCTLGYNNLRFDDEVTRNCLYRNFYDPYAREWQNNNSRWDIIDVVRAARALRPDGINWPSTDDGKPSLKLDQLTVANGIAHESAHDALSDVYATIGIARLVKQAQPKLFQFLMAHRFKPQVSALLQLGSYQPLVHISGRYASAKYNLAIILPLCKHPTNPNGVIVYDLSVDPEPLLTLPVSEIQYRLFTATADLPEGVARIPLKTVHINRCPVLAPLSVIKPEDAQRLAIDLKLCLSHRDKIKPVQGLAEKLAAVFSENNSPAGNDPDLGIYSGGFFAEADKPKMAKVRSATTGQLASLALTFNDKRLAEMLFRYKGRNYPDTLTADEKIRWRGFCRERLAGGITDYLARLESLSATADSVVLEALRAYALGLCSEYGVDGY